MAINPKILTPRVWQAAAQLEASPILGTPEAAEKLAEAKRYGALADEIERLTFALEAKENDCRRYEFVLMCAYQATTLYSPQTSISEHHQKMRVKHDAEISAGLQRNTRKSVS